MIESIGPGTSLAELSEEEFEELHGLLEEQTTGERGGPAARLAAFLGLWRTIDGTNLRVGLRRGDTFVPAETLGSDVVKRGDKVNVVMRQMYLPNLPHDRCVAQVTWQASHWFEDGKKTEVSHVTSCDAGSAGSAAAVGLPIFEGLKVAEGIGLKIAIYVMADRSSQAILDLLGSSVVSSGLKLGGKFNPIFAMTGPYIQAAIAGLTKASKRNFKLVNWLVGFGVGDAPVPLAYGEYILLDGIIRIGREENTLAWSDLKWDKDRECPVYCEGAFRSPYLMLRVLRGQEDGLKSPRGNKEQGWG
jgi:hypothetical protein